MGGACILAGAKAHWDGVFFSFCVFFLLVLLLPLFFFCLVLSCINALHCLVRKYITFSGKGGVGLHVHWDGCQGVYC